MDPAVSKQRQVDVVNKSLEKRPVIVIKRYVIVF